MDLFQSGRAPFKGGETIQLRTGYDINDPLSRAFVQQVSAGVCKLVPWLTPKGKEGIHVWMRFDKIAERYERWDGQ